METISATFEEFLPFVKLYAASYVIEEILGTAIAAIITIIVIVSVIKSIRR